MNWTPFSLEAKETFDSYFKGSGTELSDYTFTNFFLWHFSRSVRYSVVGGFLCIEERRCGQKPVSMMPFGEGDLKGAVDQVRGDFNRRGVPFSMRAVSKETKEKLEGIFGDELVFEEDRDHHDYVYNVSDLVELSGKKFRDKRNHLNQFLVTYDHSYHRMTEDIVDEVAGAQIEWFSSYGWEDNPALADEHTGILELVDNFDRLDFTGGVLKVEGKVAAFTFGEQLNDDTVVIHTEKANADIRGAYQMINQKYLEEEWKGMSYVNREEDLGIEGLRKAKQSYNPVRFIEKYRCSENS